MKTFVGRQRPSFLMLITSALMLIFTTVLLLTSFAFADNNEVGIGEGETLLTIHESGTKTVIVTSAETLGDALERADFEIHESDNVEPALDQELIASEYRVNIYRSRAVVVEDGFVKRQITTALQTPAQIIEEAGIEIRDEDTLSLDKADLFRDGAGLKVVINRAKPLKVELFGAKATIYTHATTVAEFLAEKEIELGENDRVSSEVDADLDYSKLLRVWREGLQTITVEEDVKFTTKNEYDADRNVGYSSVKQTGKNGTKLVTYDIIVTNGKVTKKTIISEVVIELPVEKVVVIGVKSNITYSTDKIEIMAAAGIKASDYQYVVEILNRENRSWCPTLWQGKTSGGCPSAFIPYYKESAQVGYGLCQATPGNKMASAGSDWRTNPVTQLKWCDSYARGYGGWKAAAEFSRCIGDSCYSPRTGGIVKKKSYWW